MFIVSNKDTKAWTFELSIGVSMDITEIEFGVTWRHLKISVVATRDLRDVARRLRAEA